MEGGLRSWNVEQVVQWARDIGLPDETAQMLSAGEVDGATLADLTLDDLKELGVVVLVRRFLLGFFLSFPSFFFFFFFFLSSY